MRTNLLRLVTVIFAVIGFSVLINFGLLFSYVRDQESISLPDVMIIKDPLSFRPPYLDKNMTMLYYSSYFGMKPDKAPEADDMYGQFHDHKCSIKDKYSGEVMTDFTLLLTADKSLEKYAHAFIFHTADVRIVPLRERTDQKNDIHIYKAMESPAYGPSVSLRTESAMNDYNLLMSYHSYADIVTPFFDRTAMRSLLDLPLKVAFEDKNAEAPLAWMGSNCNAHNGRQDYLRQLFKHIPTHSYGRCLTNMNEKVPKGDAMIERISQYKFYIAIENSNCDEYITEKLRIAVQSTVIPIVFSPNGTTPNYNRMLPPHSYINAADFESPQLLADYLKRVAGDKALYYSYFYYKFVTDAEKETLWQQMWQRFQYKDFHNTNDNNIWCRAAEGVWNYRRSGNHKRLHADLSCLEKNIMTRYI